VNQKERAFKRVLEKYGGNSEQVEELKATWNALHTGNGEADQEKGNGIIIGLLNAGLSTVEIMSVLPCGASRIAAMRHRISRGEAFELQEPSAKKPRYHAMSEKSKELLRDCMDTWDIGVGIPSCAHRRPQRYFIGRGINWAVLHDSYKAKYSALDAAGKEDCICMKYSTFTQYVHQFDPDLRLKRTEEGARDSCIQLKRIVSDPSKSTEGKAAAAAELAKATASGSGSAVAIEQEPHNDL
jgi:hypothetical protein